MPFQITPNVKLRRDKSGRVRQIQHLQAPYLPEDNIAASSPQALSASYLTGAAPVFEIPLNTLEHLQEAPLKTPNLELSNELRIVKQKRILGTTTLEYAQTHYGLPVWHSGLAVSIHHEPMRTSSSVSTWKYDVEVEIPSQQDPIDFGARMEKMDTGSLAKMLDLKADNFKGSKKEKERLSTPQINGLRLIIYRYDPDERLPHSHNDDELPEAPPITIPVPPVDRRIQKGKYYIVYEIHFRLPVPGGETYNWRAFVEPVTNSVLYLRPLVANATGYVYTIDPMTKTGNATITSASTNAVLNPLRDLVTLDGLDAPEDELEGEFVQIVNVSAPDPAIPTEGTGNFLYDVRTDDFSAVNAYYLSDRLFRMMQDMGFNVNTYFDGTTFPVRVDHRATINSSTTNPNAQAPGNGLGNGSDGFRFTLVESSEPVGMATDWRVTLHEFGHALLWDHVNSPNFGFAHSCGDSLAAILGDPGSNATDRFQTFPYVPIVQYRRHDQDVATGGGWGGTFDTGGYNSEQILSTTLFRAYRSCGGDHSDHSIREFVARYMAFLIFSAVGTLTPGTNPNDPEEFALALQNADLGTTDFEGHPGGAFHKVIRWAFEKQGAYQPMGAPTPVTTPGAPPEVDVFIDDGRNGEYEFQHNFWNTTDMWNRLSADNGLTHQTPVIGVTNYMYVGVRNRGSQSATNVTVRGYHNIPGVGLIWPDSWQAMTTAQLPSGDIPPNGLSIVGPFEWTPAIEGHECLLAVVEANGDSSNTNNITGSQTIPHWRLVPFDNNIAQRNVAPAPGGGGLSELVKAFANRRFMFTNPYLNPGIARLEAELPAILVRKGWKVKFLNPGGSKFTLGPRGQQEIVFTLEAGDDFTAQELGGIQDFTVYAFLDNFPIGGMTYHIDPEITTVPNERPEQEAEDCKDSAQKLLDCFDIEIPQGKVKRVCIKRITIDIDLENDCC